MADKIEQLASIYSESQTMQRHASFDSIKTAYMEEGSPDDIGGWILEMFNLPEEEHYLTADATVPGLGADFNAIVPRGNKMSEKKQKKLDPLYKFINDNPERKDQILSTIAQADSTFVIDNYNTYAAELDSLFAVEQDSIANALRLKEMEDAEPGFKQNTQMSDSEIMTMYEDRDRFRAEADRLGAPSDSLVQAVKQAKARKAALDPLYRQEMEYEESLMEFPGGAPEDASWGTKAVSYPAKAVSGTLMTGLGAIAQAAGGWYDWFAPGGYKEDQHETSGFPWIVPAEMYKTGLSPEAWGIEGGGDEWNTQQDLETWKHMNWGDKASTVFKEGLNFLNPLHTGGEEVLTPSKPFGFSPSIHTKEAELDSLQALINDYKAQERLQGWNRSIELDTKANTIQAAIDSLGLFDPRQK